VLDYDPNNDDPLNQYSDKEQRAMFAAAFVWYSWARTHAFKEQGE
jgi:hypothetical protein